MADPTGDLGQEHLAKINDALGQIATAEHKIALAKRAGIDVTQYEQEVNKVGTQLRQIKQVYFPNQ